MTPPLTEMIQGLARQIRRVAHLRGAYVARCGGTPDSPHEIAVIDGQLDRACRVIASGDPVAITAIGTELEGIEE